MNDNIKILELQTQYNNTKDDTLLWNIYSITKEICSRLMRKITTRYIQPEILEYNAGTIAEGMYVKMKDEGFVYTNNPVSYLYFKCLAQLFKPTQDEMFQKILAGITIDENGDVVFNNNEIYLLYQKLTIDGRGKHRGKRTGRPKKIKIEMTI